MAFEGYQIPGSIGVPRTDLPILETFSGSAGESPEQYMLGSIGLVAIWGEMIDVVEFSPGLMHGLANPQTDELSLFNIDEVIATMSPMVKQRKQISAELGFEICPDDILKYTVPEILHPKIRNACVYFGHGPRLLIAAATEIRHVVLSGQNEGLIYTFGVDGENWYDAEIDTITGDPEDLAIIREIDDED